MNAAMIVLVAAPIVQAADLESPLEHEVESYPVHLTVRLDVQEGRLLRGSAVDAGRDRRDLDVTFEVHEVQTHA